MSNAYEVVRKFEEELARFTGAPYCVTVESCSAALFLSCLYVGVKDIPEVSIPKFTYPSAASAIVHAGGRVKFTDEDWQKRGWYYFKSSKRPEFHFQRWKLVDSAKYLSKNMAPRFEKIHKGIDGYDSYNPYYICLSFHAKKTIPIGRGGAILTNDKEARDWFKCARFDGRHECALHKDTLAMAGWNMHLLPEMAARGLELMQWLPDENILPPDKYTDLSKYDFFTKANR